jgi:hypothetical protein
MAVDYDIIWRGAKATLEGDIAITGALAVTGAATVTGALALTGAAVLSSTLSCAGFTNTAGLILGGQVEIGTSGAGLGTIANTTPLAFYNFADGTAFLPLAPSNNQYQFVKNINGTGTLTLSGAIDGATEVTLVTMDAWEGIYDSSGTTWRTLNAYTA